jgi:hypothetical protein
MRVNVVRSILSVILNDYNRCIFPVNAIGNSFYHQAERIIVIGYEELRSRLPRHNALSVVIWQSDD